MAAKVVKQSKAAQDLRAAKHIWGAFGPPKGILMAMIQFRKCAVKDADKSLKLGKMIFEDGIEAVITVDPKSTLIFRFAGPHKDESPDRFKMRLPQEIQNNWMPNLERYLQGKDFCDGIPLSALTWLSLGQIETLRSAGVYSVESLAALSEGLLEPFGLDGAALRKQAQSWLDDKSGKAVARIEEQSQKIAVLEQERDETRQMVVKLQQELEALKGKDSKKK